MRTIEEIYSEIESVPDFIGHNITSVDYRNGYGDAPLHIVSNWGDCEAIETLVSAGADLNAIGESGFTPLHCAAEQNRAEAIIKLLQLGAEAHREDEDGQRPLDLAKALNHKEAINVLAKNI